MDLVLLDPIYMWTSCLLLDRNNFILLFGKHKRDGITLLLGGYVDTGL